MIVDVNVNLSRFPFRRLPFDETPRLVEKLKTNGITRALAGSFDGLLHRDISSVNARLVADCKQHGDGLLIPVGSINPMLPGWQEDVRRCAEDFSMPAVRINPNYHSYKLDDPVAEEFFTALEQSGMVAILAIKMEDVRTHHPMMKVPTVDLNPLAGLLAKHPKLNVVLANNYSTLRGERLSKLAEAKNIYFEISHAEQVGALEKLIKQVPFERLLFGSHFPFFNLESNLFKFQESELGRFVTDAIQHGNAKELFALGL